MATYFYEGNAIDADLLEKYGCNEMSPALRYAGVTDMNSILNDIKRGVLPVNTGEPFPVVWGKDNENVNYDPIDKPNFVGSNVGFVNPIEKFMKL